MNHGHNNDKKNCGGFGVSECDCDCEYCDCCNGDNSPRTVIIAQKKHSHKCVKLGALLVAGTIGVLLGAKYHGELTKTAYQSWNSAQKNKDLYGKKALRKVKKLKKNLNK